MSIANSSSVPSSISTKWRCLPVFGCLVLQQIIFAFEISQMVSCTCLTLVGQNGVKSHTSGTLNYKLGKGSSLFLGCLLPQNLQSLMGNLLGGFQEAYQY